jgi:hypothetical protein
MLGIWLQEIFMMPFGNEQILMANDKVPTANYRI